MNQSRVGVATITIDCVHGCAAQYNTGSVDAAAAALAKRMSPRLVCCALAATTAHRCMLFCTNPLHNSCLVGKMCEVDVGGCVSMEPKTVISGCSEIASVRPECEEKEKERKCALGIHLKQAMLVQL